MADASRQSELSPEAQALDDDIRQTVNELTDVDVRRYDREGLNAARRLLRFLRNLFGWNATGVAMIALIVAVFFAAGGIWLVNRSDGETTVPPPAELQQQQQEEEGDGAGSGSAAAPEPAVTDDGSTDADQSAADRLEPEPAELAPAPAGTQPAGGTGEPSEQSDQSAVVDDPFAAAAGTYRISEPSAKAALELVVDRLESASGEVVIDELGTVTGSFTFVYWDQVEGTTDVDPVRVTAVIVLEPALLQLGERLTFESTVNETLTVEYPSGPQEYPVSLPVTATVDPVAGRLELSQPGDAGIVLFER